MKNEYLSDMNILSRNKNVFFGAGMTAIKIVRKFKELNLKVDYFCDNDRNKIGTNFEDIKVLSSDELKALDSSEPINVIITTSPFFVQDVMNQLLRLGIKANIIQNPVEEIIRHEKSLLYKKNHTEITTVLNILEDDYSRETLLAFMEFVTTGSYDKLLELTRPYEKQYFDDQIFKLGDNEIFVDMGVLDAGTSLRFAKLVDRKYKKILMFEPDLESYRVSLENITKNQLENALLFNEGCYEYDGELHFKGGRGGSSRISNDSNDICIHVVSLDNKLKKLNEADGVTFIKMDIEGAEYKAICGCIETIKKYRPKLAISLYHKREDLYELPLLIKKILPEYKLFIRHYDIRHRARKRGLDEKTALNWELVCYATT